MNKRRGKLHLVRPAGSGLDKHAVRVACSGSTSDLQAIVDTMTRRASLRGIRDDADLTGIGTETGGGQDQPPESP